MPGSSGTGTTLGSPRAGSGFARNFSDTPYETWEAHVVALRRRRKFKQEVARHGCIACALIDVYESEPGRVHNGRGPHCRG